jgi:MFS family permease
LSTGRHRPSSPGQASAPTEHPLNSIFAPALRATTSGVLIVVTLVAFEAMAVAAALPTAARELHGIGGYGWAFTGFLVANVVGMVASGQISDRRGPRAPMTGGLVAFCAGLIVSGTSVAMWQLVLGRVVQGLGGGLLITALYVVIGTTYPEALSAKVFAALASAWVVPSMIGPIVAGGLAQHASWRWVFLGLVPFVLLGGVLLIPVLRAMTQEPVVGRAGPGPRRIVRAVAVAGGVAALEQAGQHPSPLSLGGSALGLAAIVWGLRTLLPAGTVSFRRGVPAAVAFRGLLAGAFFGVESLVPLSLTVQHRFSATAAALPLMVCGLTWAIGSWWQGRDRGPAGANRAGLVRAGFGFVAVGLAGAGLAAQPGVSGFWMYPAWGVAGIGAGLAMSSAGVLLLAYTNDADRGADSAALQLSDAVSSAITTGLGGILVAAAVRGSLGYTAAFTTLDAALAVVAVVGVALAGRAGPPLSR